MENKKALVIIPPYSEPLKKLGEILSSPEEAELIDIYVLEDLKEAGQLIPTLGQCLIVIANAKKCALFLQENRWAISKNHSKVILMTPKEIPQKTLMKFLKIGLTEVILETLPPKSLLYKIKLLLRSVKGQENKKEENINVKSMLDMAQQKGGDEQQRIEKGIIADSTSSEEKNENEKKMSIEEESESLDYLKAKKKTQQEENVIDTHWKSKRNDTQIELEDGSETEKKRRETEELSTYYKNERNTNLDLDFVNSDNMTGKGGGVEDESNFSIEKLKQSMMTEIELEDSMQDKKKHTELQNEDEEDIYQKEINQTTLEFEKEDSKNIETEEFSNEKKSRKQNNETEINLEKEKNNKDEENLNQIDNYYKGKLNNQHSELELEEKERASNSVEEEKTESEDKKSSREDSFDLLNNEKELAPNSEASDDENNENAKGPKLFDDQEEKDAYMRGKVSKSTKLELEDGSEEKPQLAISEDDSLSNKAAEKLSKTEEDNDFQKNHPTLLDTNVEDSDTNEQATGLEEASSRDLKQKLQQELGLDIELAEDDSSADKTNNDDDKNLNKLQRLTLEEHEAKKSDLEKNEVEEEHNPQLRKLNNTQIELEKSAGKSSNNSTIEHIDKYMRSHSSKSEDHDWNLGGKKKDSTIALQKGKSGQLDLNLSLDFKDAGEQTIDYRKLKEEFELLKEGSNLPPEELEKIRKMIRGEEDDNEESHRVYLTQPRGIDFLMAVAIDLYDPSVKPRDIFEKIAKKIQTQKGYATFLQYSKPTDIKEIFSIFQLTDSNLIKEEHRTLFSEMKKDADFFKSQSRYSLANWRCSEILDKNNKPWEDTDLPSWAANELHNKSVEYIYPMFDGLDRMGHVYVWFPEGINDAEAKYLDIIIESSRTLYLDQIIRSSMKVASEENEENSNDSKETKSGLFSGISSLFNKKKTG